MALSPPRVRVVLGFEAEEGEEREERVVLVGADFEGQDEETLVYARRDDVDVTVALPERAVELLLSFGVEEEESSPEGAASGESE